MRDRPGRDAGPRVDLWMTALSLWIVAGLFVDGWAHTHLEGPETFFTPWHGLFYSGFLATAAFVVGLVVRRRRASGSWGAAVPTGYGLALAGLGVFMVGGVGDMAWHIVFGIEQNVEALLSPTHLMLATGMALTIAAPLRAAWHRRDPSGGHTFTSALPLLVSAALVLAVLAFFTQMGHPFVRPWAATGNEPLGELWAFRSPDPPHPDAPGALHSADVVQMVGVTGLVLQSAMLAGTVLLLMRRWRLPFGATTVVLGLSGGLVGLMRGHPSVVLVAVASGIVLDAWRVLSDADANISRPMRAYAAGVPLVPFGGYFALLALTDGIWWSVHAWAGALVMGAAAGWLVSYLVFPPTSRQPPRAAPADVPTASREDPSPVARQA